jgi:ribose transport system permease protein
VSAVRQRDVIGLLRAYGTLIGFALLVAGFSLALPGTFPTPRNLLNITQQMSMLAVVAAGMTIVMAAGDFDLSVGSMASLSGIVAAITFQATGSVPLGVAAALITGIAGGTVNGMLISRLGLLPFVATLGTLTIFSGLAFLISGGKTIFGSAIPPALPGFARGGIPLWPLWPGDAPPVLPNLTLVAIVVLAVVWFLLGRTVTGRHLHVIGGNREAARLAGIPVARLRTLAFALSGLGAAVAGLMLVARVASANPIQGSGLMLDAIAAVFLGMTMSDDGEPRVLATLAGVLVLGVLNNGLTQLSVDSYVRDILVGTLIIAAVALGSASKLRAG